MTTENPVETNNPPSNTNHNLPGEVSDHARRLSSLENAFAAVRGESDDASAKAQGAVTAMQTHEQRIKALEDTVSGMASHKSQFTDEQAAALLGVLDKYFPQGA